MGLEALRAAPDDAPVIADVLREANQFKLSHGDSDWGEHSFTDQEVSEYMHTREVYLVYRDSEPIGTFSLQWEDLVIWRDQPVAAGYIHRLAVRCGFHGQGLGQEVLAIAEGEVAQRGLMFARLDCPERNTKLRAYYEKQGYAHVGGRRFRAGEHSYDAAMYEKALV